MSVPQLTLEEGVLHVQKQRACNLLCQQMQLKKDLMITVEERWDVLICAIKTGLFILRVCGVKRDKLRDTKKTV